MNAFTQWRNAGLTLGRKLRRSVSQQGLAGTAWKALKWPWKIVASVIVSTSPSRRIIREDGRAFDAQYGVDTSEDRDYGWMAAIQSPSWAHGTGFEPVAIREFEMVMAKVAFDATDFVFIDFGSGKGRSLLLASRWPFQEIIGVEYNLRLHEIAQRNIARYVDSDQWCTNIRAEHMDALLFSFPMLPLFIFLNNPFDETILRPLAERLKTSFDEQRRSIIVVYLDAVHYRVFEECDIFTRVAEGTLPVGKGEPYMVLEADPLQQRART